MPDIHYQIGNSTVLVPGVAKAYGCRIEIGMKDIAFRLATRREMWKTKRNRQLDNMPGCFYDIATSGLAQPINGIGDFVLIGRISFYWSEGNGRVGGEVLPQLSMDFN
ncbi:MAG: hypothetical protein VR65_15960 [Desulfobulbaceae bacterium BRH_c16a]|nr:MAG: hypothetical protein VR65_15960 [Desulfobulbaceae bacterium BRH_c16a]